MVNSKEETKMTEEVKEILKNIVELIEDKTFPARRNITDYVVMLLPFKIRKEAENFIEQLYIKENE